MSDSSDLQIVVAVINGMALGQVLLAILLFLLRGGVWRQLGIIVFLAVNLAGLLDVIAFQLRSDIAPLTMGITMPLLLLLGPAWWLYVRGLTDQRGTQHEWRDLAHLAWFGLGVLLCLPYYLASADLKYRLIFAADSVDQAAVLPIALGIAALQLLWIVTSGVYLGLAIRRLLVHRREVKQHFSDLEQKELTWLLWTTIALTPFLIALSLDLLLELFTGIDLIGDLADAVLEALLIFQIAVFGLRQRPVFQDARITTITDAVDDTRSKYEKSALGDERARRIAAKLKHAMEVEMLYQRPGLSLRDLSAHTGVTENHLSQVLNDTLGCNFFDFVNGHRIEDAKRRLEESDATVLDIALAVGFNARSAFYNAFKQSVGMTPTAFRGRSGAS